MSKLLRHIFLAVLLPGYLVCKGQLFSDYNFKFRTYTTREGLVHNAVKKCRSDSKGFLWIITENGLSRFDGYQFKNFQHDNKDSNSLPVNDLRDLVIDSQDRIWLAYKFGLCFYDPGLQQFTTLHNGKEQIPALQLSYLANSNILFIATLNGLLKYDLNRKVLSPTSLKNSAAHSFTCSIIDKDQNIWLGTLRYGYYKYNISTDTFHYFSTNIWPTNFFQDNEGVLFMSTWQNGFIRLNADGTINKETTYDLPSDPISGRGYIFQGCTQSDVLTGKDILWVISHNGGLALFSKKQRKFIRWFRYKPELINGIKSDFNWSDYTSPDGTVWLCTWQGLSKVKSESQQFQSAELPELNSNYYNCVTGIMNDPNNYDVVWMSVNGSGLAEYSKKKQQLVKWYFHGPAKYDSGEYYLRLWLVSLIRDTVNTIWSPSYGGLAKIKNGIPSFILLPGDQKEISYTSTSYQAKDGNIWLGGRFLQRFNPYSEKYTNWYVPGSANPKNNGDINNITQVPGGNMFIATNKGLFEMDANNYHFREIDFWKSFPDSTVWKDVRSVLAIGNKLYIGTLRGLAEMDLTTYKCSLIGEKEYVARVDNSALHKDAFDKLWIYSNNGVFRFDPLTNETLHFTSSDGIYNTSNDAAFFFDYDKDVFLGYRAAYTRFNPGLVNSNTNKPIPFITGVKTRDVFNHLNPEEYKDTYLPLTYEQNNITFDFTAIEYIDPEKLTFSYMLEGFDKKWIDAGKTRSVSYTNLPGGKFTFKVKACNSSGICSDKTATFMIRVSPPFWRTWWFYALVILTVSACSIAISRWLQRKDEKINLINNQLTKVELASLRNQMNPHFIFNSLNSIHKYIWENKPEDASEYLTKFSKLVRMILENSKEKELPLSKELETLRLYIELEHRRCNQKFDYSISVDPAIVTSNVLIPSMIIQPYVENAIWHGLVQNDQRGNLSVNIFKQGEQLICIIEDDGIGIKRAGAIKVQKQDSHQSLGLNITRERLNLLATESGLTASVQIIDLTNNTISGTKVILHLPLNTIY